jgi:MATE family multidrug resistance protein
VQFSIYTKEFQYNLKLAYPIILGMLGHTITGIVDNIMVGKIGATELAAASLGSSLVFVAMAVGIGFSTAITPLIGQADAEKDTNTIRSIFFNGIFSCTILGLFLFFMVLFCKPIMVLLNQPADVVLLANPFVTIVAFSLVPLVIFQGYKQFADGLSLTKISMYAIFGANILNIIINYLLINGIWIFPKMGIIGAAIGTLVSRIAMVIFLHYFLTKRKELQIYFEKFQFSEIKKAAIKSISKVGLPSAFQMLFEVLLFTAAIWLCGIIGKTSQAANQIALSLASLTFMFAMGLSVTAMIRVSNQKGLKDYKKLLIVARSIFLLSILIEIVFAIFFILFHSYLPQFFMNLDDVNQLKINNEVIIISGKLLLVAAFFQISDGIQVVVLGALRGLQDVTVPMYITFVAYWIVGFPISYYLGIYTNLKATGVWIGLFAGLTVAAIFLYIRFQYVIKKNRENELVVQQAIVNK